MKKSIIFLTYLLLSVLHLSYAIPPPSIIGPSPVTLGSIQTYTYSSSTVYPEHYWTVTNGVILEYYRSGSTYYVMVEFTATGTSTLKFFGDEVGTYLASMAITVNGCVNPSTPTVTFSANASLCSPRTISYTGTPPGGVIWYWQTTSTGTSTSFPTSSYAAASSGTYYVRAKNSLDGCWSSGSASYTVTVEIPPTPSAPTVSTNSCGPKILTKGTPPANTSWYWQGTNALGTDNTSPTATAATYTVNTSGTTTIYLRPYNSNGCWGTAVSTAVTANIVTPLLPGGSTGCESTASHTLYAYGYSESARWYNSAGTLIDSDPYLQVSNVSVGTYTYSATNVQSGCESTPVTFTLTVTSGGACDDYINWDENIGYTYLNGQTVQVGAAKTYSDGFGNPLQSQVKSMENNTVLASQPVYDTEGNPSLNTLPAPINSSTFGYRARFITDPSGNVYSSNDFDLPISQGPPAQGEVYNPNPVGNGGIGTLGWYYSSSNTIEPKTPTTNYPYVRSYTPSGPNPTFSKSAAAGEDLKMGSGHETAGERTKATTSELSNYYYFMPYFLPRSSEELIYYNEANSTSGYSPNLNVTLSSVTQSDNTYVKVVCNQSTSTPGISKIGGNITVSVYTTYKLRIKGYRSSSNAVNLYVYMPEYPGGNILWPGVALPQGAANEAWVESSFSSGSFGKVSIGALWSQPSIGDSFYVNAVELVKVTTPQITYPPSYKTVSTDQNGKKVATFSDADGRTIATATVSASGQYDNWSYTYYNDMGQVVATVAPKDAVYQGHYPSFVTLYKYDQLGRLIETTSTDEGTTQYVYSNDGKIRFSQNQEQRNAATKRFSYTNYDYLGRLIESGEYTQSGTNPYVFEPHTTPTPSTYSVLQTATLEAKGHTVISRKVDASRCSEYAFIEYDNQAADFVADGTHASQTYTSGQVTRTENENSTTWYSYDVDGQLIWTRQNIIGLGIKYIDYTYDFLGNVTQVAYQKGSPDAFYHHYFYNADQQLKEVLTSLDGTTATLRAKYLYYLHGPLKRVELGGNVQGIDFAYTINGQLKTINDSDPTNDPGEDGSNGFAPDVFGQTMHYFDNDYAGADFTASQQNFSAFTNQYGGALRGVSWHTAVDNNMRTNQYGFTYDNLYQLNEARFGNAGIFGDAYKESIPAYDKNGNIQSLVRKGLNASSLADYSYVYETNTNKLDKVNNSGSLLVDYTYNAIGQMTQQVEGTNTMKVSYNAYGITKEVRNAGNQLMVSYAYDDRGDLVKRVDYTNGTAAKNTFYVHDASGNTLAIYEQVLLPSSGPIQLIELPVYGAGRVAVYRPLLSSYFYEIGDHLGNVRAVIGTTDTSVYTATMESENAGSEEPPFSNITARRSVSVAANHTSGGNEAIRLNSAQPVGAAINLTVSPGDSIDLNVWAYYEAGSNYNNPMNSTAMVTAIAAAFGGISGAGGESGDIFNSINEALTGAGNLGIGGTDDPDLPGAYLCYMVFDVTKNFTGQGGYYRVTEAGNLAKEQVIIPTITIEQPGYIYVCVYNRSNSVNWVYFDDMSVTHQHSPVVAGADFFPFGLVMEGRELTQEDYRYGYQGQFAEKDSVTGWNQFQLRMYDARIGRWMSVDPYGQFASPYIGMGNNPQMSIDPDGGFNLGATLVGAAGGFVAGSLFGLAIDTDNWWKYGLVGSVGGGIGGALSGDITIGSDANFFEKTWLEIKVAVTGEGGTFYRKYKNGEPTRKIGYAPGPKTKISYSNVPLQGGANGIATGARNGLNPAARHIVEGTVKTAVRVIVSDQNGKLADDGDFSPSGGGQFSKGGILDPAQTFSAKLAPGSTGVKINTDVPLGEDIGMGQYGEMTNETYGSSYYLLTRSRIRPPSNVGDYIKVRVKSIHTKYTGGRLFR